MISCGSFTRFFFSFLPGLMLPPPSVGSCLLTYLPSSYFFTLDPSPEMVVFVHPPSRVSVHWFFFFFSPPTPKFVLRSSLD